MASYIRWLVGLITTAEAAAILKISPVRVRQYINSGQLASEKRGRDHLLSQAEVERFNRQGRRPAGRPTQPPNRKTLRVR
jgi:site-specific DNA-methyltransferase (adenine-specific)